MPDFGTSGLLSRCLIFLNDIVVTSQILTHYLQTTRSTTDQRQEVASDPLPNFESAHSSSEVNLRIRHNPLPQSTSPSPRHIQTWNPSRSTQHLRWNGSHSSNVLNHTIIIISHIDMREECDQDGNDATDIECLAL